MSTTPRAATIYTEQLIPLLEGFPLWDPSPGSSQAAVEIADVGYVQSGGWIRLFNASQSLGDPRNDLGVPEGYEQFNVGKIKERVSLPAKVPMRSESLKQRGMEVALAGAPGVPVQVGGGFSFKCLKERGAVLILGDDAERRDAIFKLKFIRYILEHYASWLTFANDTHGCGIDLSDLVFVTGCDMTSSWTCAAFCSDSSEATVNFNVEQPGIAQGGISMSWAWNDCSSVLSHSYPSSRPDVTTQQHTILSPVSSSAGRQTDPERDVDRHVQPESPASISPLPRDQCVFLRGYKVCDRRTSSSRRLAKLWRKKSYDGFEYVPRKRRDDTEDPGSGRPKQPYFRPGQSTLGGSNGSSYGSKAGGTSTTGSSSGSNSGGKSEEKGGTSTDPSEELESDWLDSETDDEFPLDVILNQNKEATPLDIILDYILENSPAELALVHDDDLIHLIQSLGYTTDFEGKVHEISPAIFVANRVGMLETTYRVSRLSDAGIKYANSIGRSDPTTHRPPEFPSPPTTSGSDDAAVPTPSLRTGNSARIAALEKKLKVAEEEAERAGARKSELQRQIKLLQQEKSDTETPYLRLKPAEGTILRPQVGARQVARLEKQTRVEANAPRAKDEKTRQLRDEWSSTWPHHANGLRVTTGQLDAGRDALRSLLRSHKVPIRPKDTSFSDLGSALGAHLTALTSRLAQSERQSDAFRQKYEKSSRTPEHTTGRMEGKETLASNTRIVQQSERTTELLDVGSSALAPYNRASEEHIKIVSSLRPLWSVLPSMDARVSRTKNDIPASITPGDSPSLSDVDVRTLKSLYDPKVGPGSPTFTGSFSVEDFVIRVQALIADDRALIDRLISFAQSHELLRVNVERAQILARESQKELEKSQTRVRWLEEHSGVLDRRHAALLREIELLRTSQEPAGAASGQKRFWRSALKTRRGKPMKPYTNEERSGAPGQTVKTSATSKSAQTGAEDPRKVQAIFSLEPTYDKDSEFSRSKTFEMD